MAERIGRIQFNTGDPEPKPNTEPERESRVRINMGDPESGGSRVQTDLDTTLSATPGLPEEHASSRVKMNFPGTAEEVATESVGRRLHGTLVGPEEPSMAASMETEMSDKENGIQPGTKLIQRASGDTFEVVSVNTKSVGAHDEVTFVRCRNSRTGASVTKELHELKRALADEDGSWQWG